MTAFRLQTADCVLQDSFYYCSTHHPEHTHTQARQCTNRRINIYIKKRQKIQRSKRMFTHIFTHSHMFIHRGAEYKWLITLTHSHWCSHQRYIPLFTSSISARSARETNGSDNFLKILLFWLLSETGSPAKGCEICDSLSPLPLRGIKKAQSRFVWGSESVEDSCVAAHKERQCVAQQFMGVRKAETCREVANTEDN